MDDLALPQEANHVIYVRVVGQAEDVVVGEAGFLFRRQILGQVGDDIAGDLHGGGGPGVAGGELGIHAGGVIDEIGVKAGGLDLAVAQVAGELVDEGAHHFQVAQFLSTYQGAKKYQQKPGNFNGCNGKILRRFSHIEVSRRKYPRAGETLILQKDKPCWEVCVCVALLE